MKKRRRLCRNSEKGIFAGVCQGLGDYFGITPWVFRLIFLIPVLPFAPISGWISLGVYILLFLCLPDSRKIKQPDDNVVEVEYEIIDDDEDDNKK